ncbi:type IV toxin-antitoxin system AbiEi family antitoxin domain-containing protein [Candidatus Poriferisodalis sp.]|uniref:type IV toxin-antitoxin system AbiEi family antitoxin domain-containing protein n=1 Tax=Candidatus Poriferisodalis sp. TaxID=3101277 RepID=UPI003B5BC49E
MPGNRQALRQTLYRLAAGQAGYFTAAQALDIGYSYQAQKHHVDHGNWARIDRGIFRIPEWPAGVNDELVRWVLWSKHRAVVSHDSAAAAYGFGVANPAKVHLSVPPGFRMDDPAVVLHYRALAETDVTVLDGAAIATALRTALDVVESHFDEEFAEGVIADAIASGAITAGQLERRFHELDEENQQRGKRLLARVRS